jgi:hypothetical protein
MSNKTQQTAVEQFAIALYEGGYLQGNGNEIETLLNQFREMEKEIIEKTYDDAIMKGRQEDGEQYYNETYGGNK